MFLYLGQVGPLANNNWLEPIIKSCALGKLAETSCILQQRKSFTGKGGESTINILLVWSSVTLVEVQSMTIKLEILNSL